MIAEPVRRILEIGTAPLMREAYPDTTVHWSTGMPADFRPQSERDNLVTLRALPRLARALSSSDYDLVVVQPATVAPWHLDALSRALFRRSALRGVVPFGRYFGPLMIRGKVTAPIALWDNDDSSLILRHNVSLLDRATLFFKRELPPDHWRVFTATLHPKLPTPRFRMKQKNQQRVGKLRPVSLGVPLGLDRSALARPLPDGEKTSDVFFAGRVQGSSTVRERGLPELLALRDKGYRIDIPDKGLSFEEYLARCARAWLVWSPEGYGYDCFRNYEASLCGSVPVLNRQTLDRYKPLRDGEHCFYYDVESGGLTQTLEWALKDKQRLSAMAQAARAFVLAEHTTGALARYVAETTLAYADLQRSVLQSNR